MLSLLSLLSSLYACGGTSRTIHLYLTKESKYHNSQHQKRKSGGRESVGTHSPRVPSHINNLINGSSNDKTLLIQDKIMRQTSRLHLAHHPLLASVHRILSGSSKHRFAPPIREWGGYSIHAVPPPMVHCTFEKVKAAMDKLRDQDGRRRVRDMCPLPL